MRTPSPSTLACAWTLCLALTSCQGAACLRHSDCPSGHQCVAAACTVPADTDTDGTSSATSGIGTTSSSTTHVERDPTSTSSDFGESSLDGSTSNAASTATQEDDDAASSSGTGAETST